MTGARNKSSNAAKALQNALRRESEREERERERERERRDQE